jgi:hypothetical protein
MICPIFFLLSSQYTWSFFIEWFSVTGIVNLNTALCSKNSRKRLTDFIQLKHKPILPNQSLIRPEISMKCIQLDIVSHTKFSFSCTGHFVVLSSVVKSNCPVQVWKFIECFYKCSFDAFNVIAAGVSISDLMIRPIISEHEGVRHMKMWHSATTNNLVIQVTNIINRFVDKFETSYSDTTKVKTLGYCSSMQELPVKRELITSSTSAVGGME